MKDFIQRFKNARKVVSMLKSGAFTPYMIEGECYTAESEIGDLWLASGSFFCEMRKKNTREYIGAFGLFWRHYVWFAAGRKFKRSAERKPVPVL